MLKYREGEALWNLRDTYSGAVWSMTQLTLLKLNFSRPHQTPELPIGPNDETFLDLDSGPVWRQERHRRADLGGVETRAIEVLLW